MLHECYCVVIRIEAVKEDDRKKDSKVEYYNELSVQRHYYQDGEEAVHVSPGRQVWLMDFDMCIPVIRGGRCFIEYVFTHNFEKINEYAETLVDHVRRAKSERPKWLIDPDRPFVKLSNMEDIEGFDYVPDLKIWS
jgi:hypothetical protein